MRPNIFHRLSAAGRMIAGRPPRIPRGSKAGNQTLMLWPRWLDNQPQWQLIDYSSYINEGMNLNALIYSAINYKVRASYSALLKAYSGDPDNPDPIAPSSPLAQLIMRPNPAMSTRQFVANVVVSLNVAGNAFVYVRRGARKDSVPEQLIPLRPDRVFIVPHSNKKELLGFMYVPEGVMTTNGEAILPRDMIHMKFVNPGDELSGFGYGLSPLSPLARSADVDNAVTHFLKLFFDRGTMPMGMLSFDTKLDDTTAQEVKDRFTEIYGSYENWSDVGVIDQGGKYEQITPTFSQLGFDVIDERNESRILGPFGVPGILIGTRIGLQRSTLANYKEAREQFWEDTFIPELTLVEDDLAYFLQSEDGAEFVRFDLTHVPALRKQYAPLITAFSEGVSAGITKDALADMLELPVGKMPDGDVTYLGPGLTPLDDEGNPVMTPAQEMAAQQFGKPGGGAVGGGGGTDETNEGAPDAEGDADDAGAEAKSVRAAVKRLLG